MSEQTLQSSSAAPPGYQHTLIPPEPEPVFNDPSELVASWGAVWGSSDEVGELRSVLVRRPGLEFARIDAGAWTPEVGGLVDPRGGWYWMDRQPPDLELIRAQHDGLVDVLRDEGVDVIAADPTAEGHTKAIYTRDPMITVPGGAIIGRLAPRMRRGEEADVSRLIARLGMPILRTICGRGLMEGGSFVKLTPTVAAFGISIRCNEEAARQLSETLAWLGIELHVVSLSGFSIHIDGHLAMVDVDKAVVDAKGVPYSFLEELRRLKIEPIWVHPDERWAANCLAVRPGRVIMAAECPYTAERLGQRGVEVIAIPYGEIHKNGGGIHCSTMELVRDPAGG